MNTIITKITKRTDPKGNEYLTLYFDYNSELRFTYLNGIAIRYWKGKGVNKFFVGQKIKVMNLKDNKYFKIFGFGDSENKK